MNLSSFFKILSDILCLGVNLSNIYQRGLLTSYLQMSEEPTNCSHLDTHTVRIMETYSSLPLYSKDANLCQNTIHLHIPGILGNWYSIMFVKHVSSNEVPWNLIEVRKVSCLVQNLCILLNFYMLFV